MTQDIKITPNSGEPQILFRGSGINDTAIELNVLSSYESATGSGTAIVFDGTEGRLLSITDNLSSGTIWKVSNITGLPILAVDASGQTFINEYGSGVTIYSNRGLVLPTGSPSSTTNSLYNVDGTLYFNGAAAIAQTYTAGTGLVLSGAEFNIDETIVQSGDNISILNNDAGYLTTESDTLQTVTDRGSNTTNSIFTSGNITATSGYFDTFDMTLLGDGSQPPHLEGRLFYDSENHTITMFNDEPDVSLQIGQELYIRVRNETPDDIPNGSVVRLDGSHGNAAPTIVLASADSEENSQVAGFATHTIESNSFGYISTFGLVRGVDTNGGMNDGDELFLSVTSGEYVNADPGIPYYSVSLGRVVVSHESNGSVFVNIGKRKLSGGDLKSVTALNQSGVPFVTYIADTNAGGVTTVSDFVYDSGNSILYVDNKQVATSGDNVSIFTNDAGYLTAHPSISAASSSDNSGRTYIQDILLDSNGHITGIATATETVVDTDTTYTAGSGLTLNGTTFDVNFVDSATQTTAANTVTTNAGKTYAVQTDASDNLVVNVPWSGGGGGTYTAGSGLNLNGTEFNIYGGSGNFKYIEMKSSNTDPQMVFTGSGSSSDVSLDIEPDSFGTALTFRGTEGNLFGITDNLSSGVIFSVADITGLPAIQYDASGVLELGEYASEIILYSDNGFTLPTGIPSSTTNSLYNVGGTLYFNGSGYVTTDTNTTYTAGSGLNLTGTEFNIHGGTGNFKSIELTSSNTDPSMIFTGSGNVSDISLDVLSDYGSASGSGTALVFEGTEGQLFSITDNLSSGILFSVADIAGLPSIEYNSSGELKLGEYADTITTYRANKTPLKSNTDASTITFDLNASNNHMVTLGGNRILAVSNASVGQKFMLRLTQDAIGSRTVTWFSTINWAGGSAPTLTSAPNKTDIVEFLCVGTNTYDGWVVAQNI